MKTLKHKNIKTLLLKTFKNANKNNNPVANSTNGYCKEIFLEHFRHLPRKIIKLKIGILSCHFNLYLQFGHSERLLMNFLFACNLKITTLRNEPMHRPNMKIKTYKNIIKKFKLRKLNHFY